MRFSYSLIRALTASLLLALAVPVAAENYTIAACGIHAKQPPPRGIICGKAGTLTKPKPIIALTTGQNATQCRDNCWNDKRCLSFSYGPQKQCKLYKDAPVSMGFKASKSGVVYTARNCIADGCVCENKSFSVCYGYCLDLQNGDYYCGDCNTSCPNSQTCQNGKCACPGGLQTDLQTDNQNCGQCGNDCGDTASCVNGQCQCGADTPGPDFCSDTKTCVDLSSDNNNCGYCGGVCGDGATCEDYGCTCPANFGFCQDFNQGPCVDFTTDDNCGGCGNQCSSDRTCTNQQCVCNDGTTECNGQCVDNSTFDTDNNNCGSCGKVCNALASCQSGTCVTPPFYIVATGGSAADGQYLGGKDIYHDPRIGSTAYSATGFGVTYLTTQQFNIDESTGLVTNSDGNFFNYIYDNTYSYEGGTTLSDGNYGSLTHSLSCTIGQGSPDFNCNYNGYYMWKLRFYKENQYFLKIAQDYFAGNDYRVSLYATTTPPPS